MHDLPRNSLLFSAWDSSAGDLFSFKNQHPSYYNLFNFFLIASHPRNTSRYPGVSLIQQPSQPLCALYLPLLSTQPSNSHRQIRFYSVDLQFVLYE